MRDVSELACECACGCGVRFYLSFAIQYATHDNNSLVLQSSLAFSPCSNTLARPRFPRCSNGSAQRVPYTPRRHTTHHTSVHHAHTPRTHAPRTTHRTTDHRPQTTHLTTTTPTHTTPPDALSLSPQAPRAIALPLYHTASPSHTHTEKKPHSSGFSAGFAHTEITNPSIDYPFSLFLLLRMYRSLYRCVCCRG